jgi:hypothetical protein
LKGSKSAISNLFKLINNNNSDNSKYKELFCSSEVIYEAELWWYLLVNQAAQKVEVGQLKSKASHR